jgi:hypothetical protein
MIYTFSTTLVTRKITDITNETFPEDKSRQLAKQ